MKVTLRERFDQIGGNRIVVALSMARLGDAVGNSILFIVLPLFVAKLPSPVFPLPESVRVGILIAMFGLVNTFFQPFAGALSDRVGKRKLFIQLGLVIMIIATLGFVFAKTFSALLGLRALQGIGVAVTIPAAMAIMVGASQKETRGGSMGIYSTLRMGGLVVGPLLGGTLFDHYGFNLTFFAGAGFIFLGLILVQLWVKEMPVKQVAQAKSRFRIIDPKLLGPGILGTAFATLVMASAFSMMVPLETQFNARLNGTAFTFAVAFSALMVSRVITQVPLGSLSDRIGRKPLIIGGLLLMVPSTALLGYATSTLQLTLLRLVQGVGSAGVAAPAFAIAGDLSKAGGEGRQMSIITMGFGLGVALGPLMAGILAVRSFQLPFVIGGLSLLLGAWIVQHYVPETAQLRREAPQAAD